MNVAELIARLQKCDPALEVYTNDSEFEFSNDIHVWVSLAKKGFHGWAQPLYDFQADRADCKVVVISPFGESGERVL